MALKSQLRNSLNSSYFFNVSPVIVNSSKSRRFKRTTDPPSHFLFFDSLRDNLTVFNANVCTAAGKIWYGDLDVTRDEHMLRALAELLGEKVYVLREMDARFEDEANPKLDKAVASF